MATGVATNRTHIDLPTEVSGEILQKAQEQSAVMQLARQIVLPGNGLTIPVITGDPEAEWVTETGVKPVKNPSLEKKVMQAYKLAVIVPFSNEFRRDASALYDQLVARLPLALAKKFDETVFHGAAPGSNFDTFASVTAQSIANANNGTYLGLVAADADIAEHGGILNGFAISPQAKSVLLTATDTTNRPLFLNSVAEGAVPMILGARTYQSKGAFKAGSAAEGTEGQEGYVAAVPNVLGFAGDWTQAMYGIVQGMDITISDQATLVVGSGQDATTINLWQQNMFAVRAEIEVGFRADTDCFNKLITPYSA